MLPTGSTKKKYFKKVTTPLKAWTQDTLRSINLKAIQNMLVSFMQKPSKTSKSRDHLDALERRLQLWGGEIKFLLLEAETIQQRLTSNSDLQNISDISKNFARLVGKANIMDYWNH